MKKMMMILAVLFAMVGSSFGASKLTNECEITEIMVQRNTPHGVVWFWTTSNGGQNQFQIVLDEVGRSQYAAILAAKNSNTKVKVSFEDDQEHFNSLGIATKVYYILVK